MLKHRRMQRLNIPWSRVEANILLKYDCRCHIHGVCMEYTELGLGRITLVTSGKLLSLM